MYSWLYKSLIYPLYHKAIGSGAIPAIEAMMANDTKSTAELESLQREKLRKLLSHSVRHVPYYAEIAQSAGWTADEFATAEEVRKLPVLTKDIIRGRKQDLVSASLQGNKLDENSTSGSTGSPLYFFTDSRSKTYRKATVVRNRSWIGVDVGDKVVNLWGSPIDQKRVSAIRGRLHAFITRLTFLSAYTVGDEDLYRYARRLKTLKPKLLIGYPSVLSEFAAFLERNSMEPPALTAIICSAEALYKEQRDRIESCFGAPVYNRYGCREVGDIAHEVPGSHNLVVNSDRILVEIIDDSGAPCAPGVIGNILVTDLDNYGMPLIRYQIGDLGAWAQSKETALGYPELATVQGRSLDVVRSPTGERVGGTFWTILFRKRPGILKFQVVQDTPGSITVSYVRNPQVAQIDEDYFRNKVAEACGNELVVSFVETAEITPDTSGKQRLVISKIHETPTDGGLAGKGRLVE